jgi:hypothetical protein
MLDIARVGLELMYREAYESALKVCTFRLRGMNMAI